MSDIKVIKANATLNGRNKKKNAKLRVAGRILKEKGISANAVYSRCFFDYFLKRLRFLCDTGRFISIVDFLICLLSLQIFRKYKKMPR